MQMILESVVELAELAGKAIMEVYQREEGFDVQAKEDASPLTEADLASDKVLKEGLACLLEGVPILSEEGAEIPYSERQHWDKYWLIDPLDGTKEFVNRNGEFTVNVALIEKGVPVLGVVHVPVTQTTYTGVMGVGATKRSEGVVQSIKTRNVPAAEICIVASRRHGGDALAPLLAKLESEFPKVDNQSIGSSLKLCLVAEGSADLYPRLAPTCEWDTAAAQAVVEAAGGQVWSSDLTVLRYNTKESLLNPYFFVVGDLEYHWKALLEGLDEQ